MNSLKEAFSMSLELKEVEQIKFKNSESPQIDSYSYDKGYEDALRAIKINLDHFKKEVFSVTLISEGCDLTVYEGESECEKLLKCEILGECK